MSKILAQLLNEPEAGVAKTIATLEKYCGYPSQDVRLLADINAALRIKVHGLNLDPDDTTGKELYHSLLSRLEKDNQRFSGTSRVFNGSDWPQQSKYLLEAIKHSPVLLDVWAMKRSAAKEILRAQPPRRLMRLYNCRSLDSLLKRKDASELYSLLPEVESAHYLKTLRQMYSSLKATDFEQRPLELLTVQPAIQKHRLANSSPVTTVPEMGVIAIWQPSAILTKLPAMRYLLILQSIEQLRLSSSLLKLCQGSPNFGKDLIKVIADKPYLPSAIADGSFPWSCLHQHYSRQPSASLQAYEPYLSLEDFEWRSPMKLLADFHPSFRWWSDASHIAAHKRSGPISLNLQDVLDNHLGQRSYGHRKFGHFQQALRDELLGGYLKHLDAIPSLQDWLPKSPAFESLPAGPGSDYSINKPQLASMN